MPGTYVINADGALEWQPDPTDVSPDFIDHCEVLGHEPPHNVPPDPQRASRKKAAKDDG